MAEHERDLTPYYRLVVEHPLYFRLVRTPLAYETAAEVSADLQEVMRSVAGLPQRRMLLDLRAGPTARNDPDFEAAQVPWRRSLRQRFDRTAVLVRSFAGALQVQRLSREDGNEPRITRDEADAVAYLTAP